MPDLIAQGPEGDQRWRRTLVAGRTFRLGREAGAWSTPWDPQISRHHADICWTSGRLEVSRTDRARNPIFVRGYQADTFFLKPGEHFVIGETTFTLADERINISLEDPRPVTEQAYSTRFLQQVRFRNADQRIEVLSRLPEVIKGATSDKEMLVRLVNILLTGLPRANGIAVVAYDRQRRATEVLHWDRRLLSGSDFAPSERLIRHAVEGGHSLVHVWSGAPAASAFTASENVDWAYCTPVPGDACAGWAIYVMGSFARPVTSASASTPTPTPTPRGSGTDSSDPHDLRDDLKFTELVAGTLSSFREVRQLERKHAVVSQFFSPVVLESLSGQDADHALAPREADVTVLFCDLRGFSRRSEESADDLLGLLHRVSRALGVMTQHILETGGVVGDFHGDAAMGFWGWPLPQQDSVPRACRAALAIRREFERANQSGDRALADFRVGIGVASGRAVAGKIGTVDQVKVTVFGPVVNLASRLEGMTKILRAPILLDECTAKQLREHPDGVGRVRRLARVRPYGMEAPLEVSELLPDEAEYPQLSGADLAAYEAALDALLAGDWALAFEQLHRVPANDRVKDFLTVFIAQHNRTPPPGWDGVIPMSSKS